jgi:hypothetical protein
VKGLIGILSVSAIVLSAANVYLRSRPADQPGASALPSETKTSIEPSNAAQSSASDNRRPTTNEPSAGIAIFKWEGVESTNYHAYIANLRKLAFPDELIREIITADVNKMYAPREEPLKVKPVPYDAPLQERRRKPTVKDIENLIQLREVQIEKQDLLQQLLGVRVPREFIHTPNSRNYEAAEYAVSQLPSEKQEEAQRLMEKEILLDDLNQARGLEGDEELAAYRKINEERDAGLRTILTPDEFERFIMNATPPGSEMQRRVMGMEPTGKEMLAIWKVTHEQWKDQGGVFGRWRANHVPPEQIKAADEKLEIGLQAALGPDRYLDYQMAVNETGQQLRNFAARYDLPRETLARAFELQNEINSLDGLKRMSERYGAPVAAPDASRLNQAEQKLESTLGPELYKSWKEGRTQRYDLQP